MNITIEEVRALFPELEMMKSEEWIEKTCKIWKHVLEISKWNAPMDAQFGESTPGIALINHTRATTLYALECEKIIKEFHKFDVEIDRDVLIAVCILHDVSKVLEYEPGDNGALCKLSEHGRIYQHGFYGAHCAMNEGFPDSVVTVITNHTAMSRVMPCTIEGMILFMADQNDAELDKFIYGSSSLILKQLGKITRK